ncbi:MAG: hypothetical protein ACPG52_04090 [Cognaticolwellia sp.]
MRVFNYITIMLFSVIMTTAYAEDSPNKSCKNAAELYEDDDLTGAIEEAQWCLDLLKQEQAAKVTSIFPDSVMGFAGSELESQNAMGFSSTVRKYNKANQDITATLSGGSGGMMNAFSSIAQLGMSSGMGQKMRIQKRTAMVMVEGNSVRIMVTLKKGGMLMFESKNVKKDQVIAFAKAFPIAELDDSRS